MMERSMELWYQEPAEKWVEALPIGNGRIGAMIYGGIRNERIALNEDTLWSGYPSKNHRENVSAYFYEARNLAKQYRYYEADKLIEKEFCGEYTEAYMPLGELDITFEHELEKVVGYKRVLDLNTAIHEIQYSIEGVKYKREYFVSYPREVLVLKMSADKEAQINFVLSIKSELRNSVCVRQGCLEMEGLCPSHAEPNYLNSPEPIIYSIKNEEEGIRFLTNVKIITIGGEKKYGESEIEVVNASEAVVIFATRSNYEAYNKFPWKSKIDYQGYCRRDSEIAGELSYEEMKKEHIADYRKYFSRVEFSLGEGKTELPTNERIKRYQKDSQDNGLISLLYHYGRYLMISASREGTQPMNLQGIWNDSLVPPWSCNFTTNINLQMNYWPALSGNLIELHEPLIQFIKEVSMAGEVYAKEYYGARGFTIHHNVDLWKHGNPTGRSREGTATYGFWPLASGWLCRHLFEHYEYTLDQKFLKDTAYPIMKSAAMFYLDVLDTDEYGYRMMIPSTSPENRFCYDGKLVAVAKTTTMTVAIIKELFLNCIRSSEILRIDDIFRKKLKEEVENMPEFQIGSDGRLMEWSEELIEDNLSHRHLSHLYGLFPAELISARKTRELAEACKKSLEVRTDEGTGWSLSWKINLWARLLDGEHALKLIKQQLRLVYTTNIEDRTSGGGVYPNLFDAHPPFQIDGNFGICAGIMQMLLQCEGKDIYLLPALPKEWREGRIKGIRSKYGLTFSFEWSQGKIEDVVVKAKQPVEITVHCGDLALPISLEKGEERTIQFESEM